MVNLLILFGAKMLSHSPARKFLRRVQNLVCPQLFSLHIETKLNILHSVLRSIRRQIINYNASTNQTWLRQPKKDQRSSLKDISNKKRKGQKLNFVCEYLEKLEIDRQRI